MNEATKPPLLEVTDLVIEFGDAPGATHRALDGATLSVRAGEVLGLVGESGSGKSTLGLAVGRLLADNARRPGGELKVNGQPVFELDDAALRELRRRTLGFVFQNPMVALDPTMRVGKQVALASGSKAAVRDLLARVGLRDIERVERSFPHQLSGGMAQRVVIAMASLDATLREQIFALLVSLRDSMKTGVVLLSHELRAVARHCDTVAVMYAGRVVEYGPASVVFARPAHPYTQALLAVAPGREKLGEVLASIPGAPPALGGRSEHCAFADRCGHANAHCRALRPELREVEGRSVACHHAGELVQFKEAA
ncbi:MAG: ABC transporter ATP-binding protein [Variovorax paradoxus]|nr:ABC transporter ATP-binding protein [Variovorax paradoxus]MBW8715124.1 ABC transporter ATP-binding protein [Variovorax paradoxus]